MGPYHFYPLSCLSLQEMFPISSSFLEEISSLSHSVVFLYFFALFIEEDLQLQILPPETVVLECLANQER